MCPNLVTPELLCDGEINLYLIQIIEYIRITTLNWFMVYIKIFIPQNQPVFFSYLIHPANAIGTE